MQTDAVSKGGQEPTWERRFRNFTLLVVRLGLAYLFFSQLFWKMPPTHGCPPDFSFTTATVEDGRLRLQRTSGLCDWLGVEAVWSTRPRPLLVTNLDNRGAPELAVDIGWAARINGLIVENFIMPNIRWMGWVIWLAEAFVVVSFVPGVLGRMGGLVALAISGQLLVGLAGISNPHEWEWTYNLMVILSLLTVGIPPGRVWGIDAWLRPRLRDAAEGGNRWAWVVYHWLT
jgi:hypothetical protein